ncbi:hypothetical protein D9M71_717670 [compost metagenome]
MNLQHFSRLINRRNVQAPDQRTTGLAGTAHQHLRSIGGHHLHAHRLEPRHLVGKGVQLYAGMARPQVAQQSTGDALAAMAGAHGQKGQ